MHHAHIDKFAYQDSPIHSLDSRIKFLATVLFTIVIIALPRNSIIITSLYAVGPFAVLVLGGIPLRFVFKHILLVSPFIIVLALTCPFYDRTAVSVSLGPFSWNTTNGWLRFGSILSKFTVTMMCMIALVSTTRFTNLLAGLQKLHMPRILVLQLGLLYRYIFVIIDKAQHILLARRARYLCYRGFGNEVQTASAMIGSLFIRSIDTAENISIAMQARGFSKDWHSLCKLKMGNRDLIFIFIAACYIVCLEFILKPIFV